LLNKYIKCNFWG